MQINPDIISSVVLRPGENILSCNKTSMEDVDLIAQKKESSQLVYNQTDCYAKGYLVFTNERLIFIQEKGIFKKKYFALNSTNFEDIQGVTFVKGLFGPQNLTFINENQGKRHEHSFSEIYCDDGEKLMKMEQYQNYKLMIDQLISTRLQTIEEEKQKARIQYVLDFSFLKNEMGKSGITLTTIKCPSCGGNVQIPENGNSFQCSYCKSVIYAHDIFDRMKKMIGTI